MPNTPVPTLSSDGWVRSSVMRLDYLLSHFFLSEYSQSYMNYGNVASLPYILAINKADKDKLTTDVDQVLRAYLSRYFKEVKVKVWLEGDTDVKLHIALSCLDDEGVYTDAGRLATIVDGKLKKVIKINNG